MKALNILELDSFAEEVRAFGEVELQSVVVSKREFGLRFHSQDIEKWMVVDMNPQAPAVILLDDLRVRIEKVKSPIRLFLEAHFVGETLLSCQRLSQYGRVLELRFSNKKSLQVRLFPHGQNLLLESMGKKISFQKPSPLEVIEGEFEPEEVRSLQEVANQWMASKQKQGSMKGVGKSAGVAREQQLKKVRKSLKKLNVDIEIKESVRWREVGEWLAQSQSLEGCPAEFVNFLDLERPFSWNLENCFEKAKKNEVKLQTVLQRKQQIELELTQLEKMTDAEFAEKNRASLNASRFQLQSKSPIKTRKLELASGATVFVGKSAKDNLLLLRKARAWDYWFHIKDIPSAHAILFRNKNQHISDAEIKEAAKFLLQTSRASSSDSLLVGKAEVLCAEKRYVQPIKGDRHGRVTHRNEKVIVIES